jgi:hypothetical protein
MIGLAVAVLISSPADAQVRTSASFRCTFKAVFETLTGDVPAKAADEEPQIVGRRPQRYDLSYQKE